MTDITVTELENAAEDFVEEYGREARHDELLARVVAKRRQHERTLRLREERERRLARIEEENRVVAQVQFVGHPKLYCYEVSGARKGRVTFDVGDYLAVFSPLTRRWELVRVAGRGRTSDLSMSVGALKFAHAVNITYRTDGGPVPEHHDEKPDAPIAREQRGPC